MRYTFARPGGTPYLTVYARESQYAAFEIAPLGGSTFETLRGEFCGQASLKFSAPPPFLAGDWLRVYLDGDPEDDPTYLGEMTGEPWEAGAGTLNCRPLAATVGKARWGGTIQAPFAEYLAYAIGRCVLPPGVSIGGIPADLATLKVNIPSELLSDTMEAARPVIENGSWGVDNRARIGMYRPDSTVNHRFVLGEAETPPGTSSDYANCVRFPYKNPDGTDAWFEGRIESEVAARGEVWEIATVSARVTTAVDNPLVSLNGTVDIPTKYSGTTTDGTGQTVPFESPSSYVAHQTALVFNTDWTGTLSTPGMFKLSAGPHFSPASPAESAMTLMLPYIDSQPNTPANSIHAYFLRVSADARGKPLDQVLEMQTQTNGAWQPVTLVPNNGSAVAGSLVVPRGQTVTIRYTQAHITAYAPYGLQINQNGQAGEIDPTTGNPASFNYSNISVQMNIAARNGDGQAVSYPGSMFPFVQDNNINSTNQIENPGRKLGPASPVTVTPPGPIFLTAGSAVLISSQYSGDVTGVALVTPGGDIPLTRGVTSFTATSWNYGGKGVAVNAFKVAGNSALIGYVVPQIASTATLAAYALALLKYRTQPVRIWTGLVRELKRVRCSGVAHFEVAGGDVPLDVQRCVYSDGTVKVECGTPVASTDKAALAGRIESLQRQIRTLGGP